MDEPIGGDELIEDGDGPPIDDEGGGGEGPPIDDEGGGDEGPPVIEGEVLELSFAPPIGVSGQAIGIATIGLYAGEDDIVFGAFDQEPPPPGPPSIGPTEFDAIFNVPSYPGPTMLPSIDSIVHVEYDVPDMSTVPVSNPALIPMNLDAIRNMLGENEPPYNLVVIAYTAEDGQQVTPPPGYGATVWDYTSETWIDAEPMLGPPDALLFMVDITEYLTRQPPEPPEPPEPMGYRGDIERPAGALYFGASLQWSGGYHSRAGVEALSFVAVRGGADAETFTPSLNDYYPLPDMIAYEFIPSNMGVSGNFLFIEDGKPAMRFGDFEGAPERIGAGFAVRLPDSWKTADAVRVVDFTLEYVSFMGHEVIADFSLYLENNVAVRSTPPLFEPSGPGTQLDVPAYAPVVWSRDEDLTVRRFQDDMGEGAPPVEAVDTWGSPQARFVIQGALPDGFNYERGRMVEFMSEHRVPMDGTRFAVPQPPGGWRVRRVTVEPIGDTEPGTGMEYDVQVSIYVGGQLAAVTNIPFQWDAPDDFGAYLHWDGWAPGGVEFSMLAPPEVPAGTTTLARLSVLRSPQVALTSQEMDGQDQLGGPPESEPEAMGVMAASEPQSQFQWMDYVNTTETVTTVVLDPRVAIMDAQSFQRMLMSDPTAQRVVGRLLANAPGGLILRQTIPNLQEFGYRAPAVFEDEWRGVDPAPGTNQVMSVLRQKGPELRYPSEWNGTAGPPVFTAPYVILPIYYGPAPTGAGADIDVTALTRGGQPLNVTRIGHFARTVFYAVELAAPDIGMVEGLVEDYDTIIINAGEYYSMGICVYGVDPLGGGGGN